MINIEMKVDKKLFEQNKRILMPIPKSFIEALKWKVGEHYNLEIKRNKIIMKKMNEKEQKI